MSSLASDSTMSQRRKTVLAAVEAYNEWSVDRIMSYRHPDALHEILPKSLQRPPMTNTQYTAFFSAMVPYFYHFHITINEVIEDASSNKIAIWAKSTAETDIGPYANEYMLVFYTDEKGEFVTRSLEFVDSGMTKPYMVELGKFIKEKEGSDGFEKRGGEVE